MTDCNRASDWHLRCRYPPGTEIGDGETGFAREMVAVKRGIREGGAVEENKALAEDAAATQARKGMSFMMGDFVLISLVYDARQ